MTTLQFALVLTVAAIPVAMPTVLSVTMAVGARVLARGQAIVSRLASIEELAGVDVLCSDKTGTLTQNKLALGEPFLLDGTTREEILLAAALASRVENPDAIDQAVLAGCGDTKALEDHQLVHFQPFDPVHKRTEAVLRDKSGTEFKTSKGAPQVILDLVSRADDLRARVNPAIDRFAARGFRSLGVARTDEHGDWEFLGVLPLSDPPREDSKATVATARRMGCRVKMVTGDQLAIGREIAAQLDIGNNLVDATMFQGTGYHESAQVDHLIEQADGFAQVYPEHKFHIVDVLQKHGHIVGMTGDGVNDAPALKKADCGVAVSGATDAARAAADIVLLSPGLSVGTAQRRCHSLDRLRPGAVLEPAREVEHASRAGNRQRVGTRGGRRFVRTFLSGRTGLRVGPQHDSVADLLETLGSRSVDDLRDPHPWAVLVSPPGAGLGLRLGLVLGE